MMEVVVTTGAISRAKFQSNHHHRQTNTQFLQAGCPSCRPTNSVNITHTNSVRIFLVPERDPDNTQIEWLAAGDIPLPRKFRLQKSVDNFELSAKFANFPNPTIAKIHSNRFFDSHASTSGRHPKFKVDFLVQRYIFVNIFMQIRTVVLCEVAHRQINKRLVNSLSEVTSFVASCSGAYTICTDPYQS